jgi:hypothetical protein
MSKLTWDFNPSQGTSLYKVVAKHKFHLPDWSDEREDCCIDITEVLYYSNQTSYRASILWFNRGITIVRPGECFTLDNAIELTETRLKDLGNLFLV